MRALQAVEPVVREFEPRDAGALVAIGRALGDLGWSRSDFLCFPAFPGASLGVIALHPDPGVPIGWFAVEQRGADLHVVGLAVAEELRRRGVGTFALRRIEELARRRGCGRVTLEVAEWNLRAQLLFRKAGFLAVEIRKGFYARQDGYRMEKDCAPRRR